MSMRLSAPLIRREGAEFLPEKKMFTAGTTHPETPTENTVVVAVKAEKEISKTALQWALTHIVRPGDFVTLLAVVPPQTKGRRWRLWSFPKFTGDCANSNRRQNFHDDSRRCEVSASCSQMALQFHGPGGENEVNMRIKVLMSPDGSPASGGAVAVESKRVGATWIVLDKQLKEEAKYCMEELNCNIVLMNRSHAKVLRLNLGIMQPKQTDAPVVSNINNLPLSPREFKDRLKHSTPISSPEEDQCQQHQEEEVCKASIIREYGASSLSSSADASPFSFCGKNPLFEKYCNNKLSSKVDGRLSPLHSKCPTTEQKHVYEDITLLEGNNKSSKDTGRTLQEKFSEFDKQPCRGWPENHLIDGIRSNKESRDAASFCRVSPSIPPPLCSVCRHKTPLFGKPPRWFSYEELDDATDSFSEQNFLAEGGYGLVHRGVLRDGQVVAVKRMKFAGGAKGDGDFRSEVEVLSRAQHRNVVLLIGFCVEATTRMLVYEYICNGSLYFHLHGRHRRSLDWHARARIGIGAARGLRYLHEDCRVGFVHRDVRPNNILLTHDYEPLIADFGLARWQSDCEMGSDTRAVGTFGYLAPEYIETGAVTEKVDVYAFGVVLLELLTGRRAMDLSQPKGQQFLVEWARPVIRLAEEGARIVSINRFLDPCLEKEEIQFFAHQLNATAHAASLCLRRDPLYRPSMSKVLRILEGDENIDMCFSTYSPSNTAGQVGRPIPQKNVGPKGSHSMRFSKQTVSTAIYKDRDRSHVF